MAEETPQIPESTGGDAPSDAGGDVVDMEVETGNPQNPTVKVEDEPSGAEDPEENGVGEVKREREEGDEVEEGEEGALKKPKVESSVEEERLEKVEAKGEGGEEAKGEEEEEEEEEDEGEEEKKESTAANLGPKVFSSSVEMFDYFYKLLHTWSPNLDVNKYEHMVLLDLLKKGHAEPDKKIGAGIEAFQVRYHPTWKSRCFFVLRVDGSVDDFSFRKCVDHIIPLPENMKALSASGGGKGFDGKKAGGHHKGGRGGGRWGGKGGRGRGRRGKF
ncbi:protein DCL, chloroplastic [Ananas comosus]|uniref:Protein DCL, chloroplastic n=1 Tax=Ananas comosus TaxID=4615 RepID=A0A6P5GD39_ANACO|nr:protein DCL, chloroplastic [Ananas comosus]